MINKVKIDNKGITTEKSSVDDNGDEVTLITVGKHDPMQSFWDAVEQLKHVIQDAWSLPVKWQSNITITYVEFARKSDEVKATIGFTKLHARCGGGEQALKTYAIPFDHLGVKPLVDTVKEENQVRLQVMLKEANRYHDGEHAQILLPYHRDTPKSGEGEDGIPVDDTVVMCLSSDEDELQLVSKTAFPKNGLKKAPFYVIGYTYDDKDLQPLEIWGHSLDAIGDTIRLPYGDIIRVVDSTAEGLLDALNSSGVKTGKSPTLPALHEAFRKAIA